MLLKTFVYQNFYTIFAISTIIFVSAIMSMFLCVLSELNLEERCEDEETDNLEEKIRPKLNKKKLLTLIIFFISGFINMWLLGILCFNYI